MKARKLVAAALALGVVVGSLGVAEAARKKPKKPKKPKPPVAAPVQVDQKFFMRRDACEGAGADSTDNARLSLEDGPDEGGNTCGWLDSGVLNEVYSTSGAETPVADVWPVADGLPLVLDATKPVAGTINVRSSWAGPVGIAAGQVEMIIDITGVSGGEDVVVGSATVSYEVTPAAILYEVPFEIKPGAELDKKSFESLVMTTTIMGPNAGHGLYELDEPPSTVTIPAWVVQ